MGGGAPSIPQRQPGPEWQTVKKLYGGQENQLNQYINKDPLLSKAYPYATKQLSDVAGLQAPLQTLLSKVPGQFDPLISSQEGLYSDLQPTLQRQGALTPEQERDVTQATRAGFAARGNVMGNQALGGELLNRDIYRQQRYSEGLKNALSLSGSIAGLSGAETGVTGGLASGIQGLGTQGLQNVLGTSRAAVQNFSQLTNPILGYLQDLFSSNQNAAGAQSVAGANKSGGATSGALGAVGSIAGAVIPALL